MFGVVGFVLPNHYYVWWGPDLLGMAEHLPNTLSMESSEFIPCFALFVWLLFDLLNCFFLNP